jgi:DNA-binding response OmpR family regulator
MRILYIEDNRDTADAVKIMLTGAGYEVELAFNGKDGLAAAQKGKFDLILLDIMLPDMSGWDIFDGLKQKVKTKYAFLSAIPVSHERLAELKKAGVSDYIMKPFTKSDLVSKVKKILKS